MAGAIAVPIEPTKKSAPIFGTATRKARIFITAIAPNPKPAVVDAMKFHAMDVSGPSKTNPNITAVKMMYADI